MVWYLLNCFLFRSDHSVRMYQEPYTSYGLIQGFNSCSYKSLRWNVKSLTDFIRIIRPSFVLLSLNVGMGRVVTIPENPSKPSKSDLDFFLYSMCVIYRDTCWKRLRFKGLLEFLCKKPVYKKKKICRLFKKLTHFKYYIFISISEIRNKFLQLIGGFN